MKTAAITRARRGPRSPAGSGAPVTAHAAFQKACHYLCVEPAGAVDPTASQPTSTRCAAHHPEHRSCWSARRCRTRTRRRSHHRARPPGAGARSAAARRRLHRRLLLPYFRRLGVAVPPVLNSPCRGQLDVDGLPQCNAFAAKAPSVVLYRSKSCAGIRSTPARSGPDTRGQSHRAEQQSAARSPPPGRCSTSSARRLPRARQAGARRERSRSSPPSTPCPICACSAGRAMNLVAFTSDTVNVFHVIDEMKEPAGTCSRSSASRLQGEHPSLGQPASARWVEPVPSTTSACVAIAKTLPSGAIGAIIRGRSAARRVATDAGDTAPDARHDRRRGHPVPSAMARSRLAQRPAAGLTEVLLPEFLNEIHVQPPTTVGRPTCRPWPPVPPWRCGNPGGARLLPSRVPFPARLIRRSPPALPSSGERGATA